MYDTICLRSIYIEDELAEKIKKFCVLREGVVIETGEIMYQITTGSLTDSGDARIRIKIDNKKLVKDENQVTRYMDTPYWFEVECSVHKLALGHNVYGGSDKFHECCEYFIRILEKIMDISLPHFLTYEVRRIDFAKNFNLKDEKTVMEYVYMLHNTKYARREKKTLRYNSSIYFPGSSTTTKIYAKGKDFKEKKDNDYKRLLKIYGIMYSDELHKIAQKMIRIEVEIHNRKLKYDLEKTDKLKNDNNIRVWMVDDEHVKSIFNTEIDRIYKEIGDVDMKKVRTMKEVIVRLHTEYDGLKANTLYSTWCQLVELGETEVKKFLPERTYYRHRKQLKEAGVSWIGTEIVQSITNIVPVDFTPSLTSSYMDKNRTIDLLKKMAV